jgi:hypothetical protein
LFGFVPIFPVFVVFDAWKWEILIKRRQAVERGLREIAREKWESLDF